MRAPFAATYTVLDHTADIGFILQGDSPEALFARAVEALFAVMGAPARPGPGASLRLSVAAATAEDALFTLLSDLIFRFEVHGEYWLGVDEVEASEGPDGVSVALAGRGCVVDRACDQGLIEVKAPTYHGLAWRAVRPGLFAARVILDL